MSEFYEKMLDEINSNVPASENEYLGADGFMYCAVCHAKTQTRVVIEALGIDKIVNCICDCQKKKMAEEDMRIRRQELERKRRGCFAETNMAEWTFERDDRKNARISDAMQRYADGFRDFMPNGKGLLLYGPVGTGKTYYAACIANRLIEKGYRVKMTNFARIANQLQGTFEGKDRVLDDLNDCHLLIIDDLGAERKTEYMQEIVFNIIDSRYRSGYPFIITTNLTADEIKKPQEVSFARIYDRILERCFPVEVTGASRRRQEVKDTYADIKAQLGL